MRTHIAHRRGLPPLHLGLDSVRTDAFVRRASARLEVRQGSRNREENRRKSNRDPALLFFSKDRGGRPHRGRAALPGPRQNGGNDGLQPPRHRCT